MKLVVVFFLCALPCSLILGQTVVQMEKNGGVYYVPCTVNGLKLKFIFDTGASDVSISLSEALFMLKNDYMTHDNLIGTEYYKIANGQIEEGTKLNINKLEIGGSTLTDVSASIVHSLDAPLLLGQSVLERLGNVYVNYTDQTLTLGGDLKTTRKISLNDLEKSAKDFFDEAGRINEKGDHVLAIELYTKAIELDHEYFEAYGNRGFAKRLIGDFKGAIADFNIVIQFDPKSNQAYMQRGLTKDAFNDYRGAISDYNKAIALNPAFANSYGNRGRSKAALQDYRGAISDFTKVLEIDPNNSLAFDGRGTAKWFLKDYKGALIDYNKSIELDSNNPVSFYNRAMVKFPLNQKEGACLDLSKAAELGHPTAYDEIRKYCN